MTLVYVSNTYRLRKGKITVPLKYGHHIGLKSSAGAKGSLQLIFS